MQHPFADLIGLAVEPTLNGSSTSSITTTPQLKNPQGVVHGAVLYALADTGMGAAIYPLLSDGYLCATIEIKMNYFAPVFDGDIVCETKIINQGKSVANLESEIRCGDKLVAKANGNFAIFKPRNRTQ